MGKKKTPKPEDLNSLCQMDHFHGYFSWNMQSKAVEEHKNIEFIVKIS